MSLNILKSRWFVWGGAVVLFSTMVFLGKEFQKKYQIRAEIRQLEEETATLESKNLELLEFVNYFKTSEYKERQARAILGLQKPGEFVVALPADEENTSTSLESGRGEDRDSNLKKWLKYFFAK